ncbi:MULTISPECIES: histidine phosphotransferase family protein [unclassified Dinoroseobacter]|uniref:histidine phosphotransferase family protein n=1 Tax=unclassified Dinoroseobacter TaxID=2620028 RepID=UPI003C7DDC7D
MSDPGQAGQAQDLSALIGSRICHDLISPLGAIGNGLELLQMSGASEGPEMALIAESVESANARIRFFRIAYGDAQVNQMIKGAELRGALHGSYQGGRLVIDWQPEDMLRSDAKKAFLTLQCLETAMPYGGTIRVTGQPGALVYTGTAQRFAFDEMLWNGLAGTAPLDHLRPAQVQFALLRELGQVTGRPIRVVRTDETTLSVQT